MNVSSRCEYACRAMVELAMHAQSKEPLNSMTIAERRRIPEKYLVHILLQLKRAGLVRSVRGAQGGYMLGRAPESVTLLDIVQAIDGAVLDPPPLDEEAPESWRSLWRDVARKIEGKLAEFTLRQMVDREPASSAMYFI